MEHDNEEIKTLFSQLSRLEASLFYLENMIESFYNDIDKDDVEISIKTLKELRDKKQARLNELIFKN